jgi:signal transduction histidine kinase
MSPATMPVTQRVSSPQDLVASVERATLAAQTRLVAALAHELNTPLGALCSSLDMLRRAQTRGAAPEVMEAALDRCMEAAERIDGTLSGLRRFAHLDGASPAWIDPRRALEAALTSVESALPAGVRVRRQYQRGLPVIEGDPAALHQALHQILHNAAQALVRGGELTLRLRADAATGRICFEVTDDGEGIPGELQPLVFEPGFSTRGPGMGLGLGLPLARHILQTHGGQLSLTSQPGRGTRVRAELPAVAPRRAGQGAHHDGN